MIVRLLAAVAATTALLCAAGAAQAAVPFSPGSGAGHDLAVGSDGSGHLAMLTEGVTDEAVVYCRAPAGGAACNSTRTLNFDGPGSEALGRVQVFAPEVNMIVIYAGCTQCPDALERAYRWISVDNGATFGPAELVGEMRLGGEGEYIGTGAMLGVNGGSFQAMASIVNPITLGGGGFVYSSTAARGEVVNEAVFAANDLSSIRYRVFNSPPALTPDAANVAANWEAAKTLSAPEPDNAETHLTSGGNGLLLSYLSSFSPADVRIGLRNFDSATDSFGAPVYVPLTAPVDTNGLDFPHHAQDAGSRIHVVWRTLHDGGRLRYARSDDGGGSFSAPANLAVRETFLDPVVAAGPAGTGFAAWRTTGGAIRAVAIDPQPEPTPSPGGGDPGPGPGSDTSPPTAGGLRAGDSTLLPGQRTSFRFSSSEAGMAVLTFQKRVKGLKVRKRARTRCLPQTKRRLRTLRRSLARRGLSGRKLKRAIRKRACKPWKGIGQIRQAVAPGQNTIAFNGRIAGRRLTRGSYRALLVITDNAGNVSRTERVSFKVVAKKKRR